MNNPHDSESEALNGMGFRLAFMFNIKNTKSTKLHNSKAYVKLSTILLFFLTDDSTWHNIKNFEKSRLLSRRPLMVKRIRSTAYARQKSYVLVFLFQEKISRIVKIKVSRTVLTYMKDSIHVRLHAKRFWPKNNAPRVFEIHLKEGLEMQKSKN